MYPNKEEVAKKVCSDCHGTGRDKNNKGLDCRPCKGVGKR